MSLLVKTTASRRRSRGAIRFSAAARHHGLVGSLAARFLSLSLSLLVRVCGGSSGDPVLVKRREVLEERRHAPKAVT
jgi:hypothetical protein